MKKKFLLLTFVLVISLVALPKGVGAVTLKEYEDAVEKYTAELRDKNNKIAQNQEEIKKVREKINEITKQIDEVKEQILEKEREIEESNQKIEQKKEEIKRLMKYFQIINGENSYLEYVFGATSITDMIYRISIVEQLTEHNKEVKDELTKLVEENKRIKKELGEKEEELSGLKASLEKEKNRIQGEINSLESTIPSVEGQIKLYKQRVSYYKSRGCKSSDVIGVTCDIPTRVTSSGKITPGAVIGANGFRFPVNGGRITQAFGNYGHKGVDIGYGYGAPIYAVAPGRVYYTGSNLDVYGAKMVLVVHNVNGRLVFSQYCHLQSIYVSSGQDVDTNTVIGEMGSTGYSTGPHLHLEMSQDYGWAYNASYYEYIKHIINPFTYVPRP